MKIVYISTVFLLSFRDGLCSFLQVVIARFDQLFSINSHSTRRGHTAGSGLNIYETYDIYSLTNKV